MHSADDAIDYPIKRLSADAADRCELTLEGKIYADVAPVHRVQLNTYYSGFNDSLTLLLIEDVTCITGIFRSRPGMEAGTALSAHSHSVIRKRRK